MAKTREDLKDICIRKTKDNSPDAVSGFNEDLMIAEGIVDLILNGTETRLAVASLSLIQGTENYDLDDSVASVEQMRITSPTDYEKVLHLASKIKQREVNSTKSNDSQSIPTYWYPIEPTISSTDNSETKRVSFDVIPDRAYTVEYSYIKKDGLMDTDAKHPFFDERLHHILSDYAIWQYYEREPDEAGDPLYWENKWKEDLEMIIELNPKESKDLLPIAGPDQYQGD